MHKVTSGHVEFSRTKNDDEYGINRTAKVMLAFQLPDDAPTDAHLLSTTAISGDCVRFVNAILARPPGANLDDVQAASGAAPQPAGKVTDKDKLAAEVVKAPEKPKAAKPPKVEPPKAPAVDAATVVEDPTKPAAAAQVQEPAASPGTASAAAAEMSDDDLLTGVPADVTDEDLTSAITRKNAEIKNPQAIRQLIGKYIAPPGQARQIDKKLRPEFLKELATLAPATA